MLDETLALLMGELRKGLYGLICMRSYGYDKDFRLEYPGNHGRLQVFTSTSKFLAAIGQRITFLSACVINKSLLSDVNALPYIDTNLVQVNLAILATVRSKENLFINRYLVAGKRNNSGGYNFYKVFVSNLYKCLESQAVNGLTHAALSAFKRKMLVSFYPYYLLIDRLGSSFRRMEVFKAFSVHYGKDLVFYLTVAPIILLPAPLAVVWGVGATLIGRVMDGDFRRGLFFIKNHLICSKQ
jgi:abequosyltransferase